MSSFSSDFFSLCLSPSLPEYWWKTSMRATMAFSSSDILGARKGKMPSHLYLIIKHFTGYQYRPQPRQGGWTGPGTLFKLRTAGMTWRGILGICIFINPSTCLLDRCEPAFSVSVGHRDIFPCPLASGWVGPTGNLAKIQMQSSKGIQGLNFCFLPTGSLCSCKAPR